MQDQLGLPPSPTDDALRDAEHLGGFGLGEVLVPDQVEYLPLLVWEGLDLLVELGPIGQAAGFVRLRRRAVKRPPGGAFRARPPTGIARTEPLGAVIVPRRSISSRRNWTAARLKKLRGDSGVASFKARHRRRAAFCKTSSVCSQRATPG